jgi:tetratricopeptide (TPR) repeat protein
MLRGVFRTKEGKIIAAILGLIVITIGVFVFINKTDNKQFVEQAVMAENYLKSGSFEQAVEAYTKALSIKDSDQQLLSIGLAEAYVGMNDYDNALEVLRSYYQKTSGIKIKEKIEEVTSAKTDYEYLQSISRGDIYFANSEYDKAITEYEKAKLIKSKEVTAYKLIAEAYIEIEEYNLAREEVIEGQALTQSHDLAEVLAKVNTYLLKEQYDTIVELAAEYIYQENYKDGIAKYEEAILLLPEEAMAYNGLVETYLTQKKYNKAVLLLQDVLAKIKNDELANLLEKATALKEAEDQRNNILSELYHAMEDRDATKISAVLNLDFFQEEMAADAPIYYGSREGNIQNDYGMIIYDSENVYLGNIKNSVKKGKGFYYTQNNKEQGYYYYEGEWYNDIPNGEGKTEEVRVLVNEEKIEFESKTITEGLFYNAMENGTMQKYFYVNGEETGRVQYSAQNGISMPMTMQSNQSFPTTEDDEYIIGMLYLGDQPTGEYYKVEPHTIWGVKPFM